MRRRHPRSAPYSPEPPAVLIEFAIRGLPAQAQALKPDPDWQKNEPMAPPAQGWCPADAATLGSQVDAVLLLSRQGSLKELTAAQSAMLLSAVEAQAG